MALEEGAKLGPYEILARIGAGGMGEVYKARDTRLDRIVAVKVLAETVADREQLRERLSREAKAVSSLNHPNICALFDVGHQDGIDYLVMEYLEGETLAARLDQGPVPIEELIRFATQIADALATAHKQGLIHRDLKPGNIMLAPSGAKLLDFGLAKSFESGPASHMTAAATATSPLTAEGTIVGTYQYMAPEQLEGGAADARSDIFAYGAVLYEMATGRKAFEGKTQAGLIASILKEIPRPLNELAPMTPPALGRLVATCLDKDPEARRQTMADVLVDLRWIAEGGSEVGVPAPVSRRRRTRERILALAALAGLAAAVVFAVLWQRAARPQVPVSSSILAPDGVRTEPEDGFALSPDGGRLVFVGSAEDGQPALWLRSLADDRATAQRIPGTEGAWFPFWSPDGRHIGYFAGGKLWRVDSHGGPTQSLAVAADGRGGTWNAAGTIVFSSTYNVGLARVPDAGGKPEAITTLDNERGEASHRWPWFLPDGRHVLFLSQTEEGGTTDDDQSRIEVVDLETGERRPLFRANSSFQYSATGHILFWSQGALYAQPFDADSQTLSGDFFPVRDRVQYSVLELAAFSAAHNGSLVYQGGEGVTGMSRLAWYDRTGEPGESITDSGMYFSPRLSGDGKRVAYHFDGDIWVRDLARGSTMRLSFESELDYEPVWGPDDRWIYYSADRGPGGVLVRKLSSGVGAAEELLEMPDADISASAVSPDGKTLYFVKWDPETQGDIWTLSLEDGEASPLLQTPFNERDAQPSPDGNWLVYSSNESGVEEVYVVRLSGPGGRWQVSTESGWQSSWSADGAEIVYVGAPGRRLMSVSVTLGETFTADLPQLLFDAPLRPGGWNSYAPAPDGQSFLLNVRPETGKRSGPFTLLQGWLTAASAER